MRARLLIPTYFNDNESVYSIINDFHFTLIRMCIKGTTLAPKIGNLPVCDEFFRRVYAVPFGRYNRLCNQVLLNYVRPDEHGNTGRFRRSKATYQRTAALVNILTDVAEPMPDGKGYILPSSMTKA